MLIWLDVARFILIAVIIGFAAWKDHKTGEVSNKVWLYAPVGFTLTIIQCLSAPQLFIPTFLSVVCTLIVAFGLFYLNGWGGADAKAFITLAASMPVTPFLELNPIFMYPLNVIWICSLIAFFSALVTNKKKVPIRKLQVRFLPYVLFAMILAVAI